MSTALSRSASAFTRRTRPRAALPLITLGIGVSGALLACGGGSSSTSVTPPPPPPSTQCVVNSLSMSPAGRTISVGDSVEFNISENVSNCAASTPSWYSKNTAVATVSAAAGDSHRAIVRGVSQGSTEIRVTVYNSDIGQTITIAGPPLAAVASVAISPSTASVMVGATTTLVAMPRDAAGNPLSGRAVTWRSESPSVASVSASGVVTGLAAGTATITATVEGHSATAAITVSAPQPVGVRLAPAFRLLALGGSTTLAATDGAGAPLPASQLTVVSRNPAVATVSGLAVTGVAPGVTDVVAANGPASDSSRIAVTGVSGFAVLVAKAADQLRTTAAPGSTLTLDVLVVRPSGAAGDVASLSGKIAWDPAQLALQSSAGIESGWAWTPNPSAGTLTFAAFSTTGTQGSFAVARLTFTVTGAASATPRIIAPSITSAGTSAGQSLSQQAVGVPSVVVIQ